MSEYVKQARDFLESCGARMEISYLHKEVVPDWGDNEQHNKYLFTIITPLGILYDYFYDSVYNTKRDIRNVNEYDILACLEKYDVGNIDDFVSEFGYEVHKWSDVKRIENIYKAVVRQYKKLCEIFTPEQMERLREIQ